LSAKKLPRFDKFSAATCEAEERPKPVDKLSAYEMYAHKMYAHGVHGHEVHAYVTHAGETHAHEVHTREMSCPRDARP
jgi:hypothetical protein